MANLNLKNVKFDTSFGTQDQLTFSTMPEIVFCGRSNCGKSSLLNKLCNQKNLARVSSTPGKTTLINFYSAGDCKLVDLPGYGFASRSNTEINRWTKLIEAYFNSDRNIALVCILLDIRHNPTNQDINMLNYINEIGLPACIAFTKADKLSNQKTIAQMRSISKLLNIEDELPCIITSSKTSKGINELQKCIKLSVE